MIVTGSRCVVPVATRLVGALRSVSPTVMAMALPAPARAAMVQAASIAGARSQPATDLNPQHLLCLSLVAMWTVTGGTTLPAQTAQAATTVTVASGFSHPSGVAVDGGNNVVVPDTTNKSLPCANSFRTTNLLLDQRLCKEMLLRSS